MYVCMYVLFTMNMSVCALSLRLRNIKSRQTFNNGDLRHIFCPLVALLLIIVVVVVVDF